MVKTQAKGVETMIDRNKMEAHWELLLTVAREELEVDSFEPTGKLGTDLRLVRVENVGRALERAYDYGLLVGRAASQAECACEHGD
jgi:hypothetical protein